MSSLTQENVEQLHAIARLPDPAEARRQLAGMLRHFEPIKGRAWTEFSPRAVIAFLFWLSGMTTEAMALVVAAARLEGADDLGRQIMAALRHLNYTAAIDALHQRSGEDAKALLSLNLELFGEFLDAKPERAMLDLIAFAEAAAAPPSPRVAPTGRPSVVSICVWGERFIAAAERTSLACCLAPENLPALRRHGTVYLRISTRARDVDAIRRLPVMRRLLEHVELELAILPEHLLDGTHLASPEVWTRFLIAASNYADLMFARGVSADFFPVTADALVASTYFSRAKSLLASGRVAVVVPPIRSRGKRMLARLDELGCRQGDALVAPADTLYRAGFEAIHPFVARSFMRQEATRLPVDPVQFYFPIPGGFSLHAFHLNTIAAATGHLPERLACDFHTYDTRLLSDLLQGRERERDCYIEHEMPGEMFNITIDEDDAVAEFGDFELSPNAAAAAGQKWMCTPDDIDHFIWAIAQKFRYRAPAGVSVDAPADCLDEDAAVAAIRGRIDAARPAILNYIGRFRH